MNIKNIHIFGGGTVAHITNHFAVCAPAYGNTAHQIERLLRYDKRFENFNVNLELTRMAGGTLETNEDVFNRIQELKQNYNTKIIIFNVALVDYLPDKEIVTSSGESIITGKYNTRLNTRSEKKIMVEFHVANKIISDIRYKRKDIFLVGFKTTCGATKQEMYEKALKLCKESSVNLVLVNDVKTKVNFIVTPEEASYGESTDRETVLKELLDITYHRSHLTFTQSTVVEGVPVKWNDERIPNSLRTVVNYCISNGGYKPFGEKNSTAGHFAVKLSDNEFLTSIRKSNLNELDKTGMVYVKTDGPDTVIAYGAKPSVGGQSQRIVFNDHIGFDCIVHFHSELKKNPVDSIPIISQREAECGSHTCGKNTSNGLQSFEDGQIKAVMLNNHGPNIVFNKNINPSIVIDFITRNWDLNTKTGGFQI